MGGTDFKWGSDTTGPPVGDGPVHQVVGLIIISFTTIRNVQIYKI